MTIRRNQVLALAAPITLWAIHFTILYALVSAACSPRALMSITTMQTLSFIATIIALIGAGLPILRVPARRKNDDMATAIRLAAVISVIAIVLSAVAFPFFTNCGG